MRKFLLAAASVAVLSSPAVARDGAWYVGLEGGIMAVRDMDIDYQDAEDRLDNAFEIDFKRGFDVDLIGGYDMGMFRLEAETAYKRANVDGFDIGSGFSEDILEDDPDVEINADGRGSVLSAMANALVDFDMGGIGAYAGGGIGVARVKVRAFDNDGIGFRDTDRALAYQLIAGVRAAVSENMDVGLKYRYFRTGNLDFRGDDERVDFGPFNLDGRWQSHSLLASLIFNFAPPPPPPPPPPIVDAPPPPPPPATQVCPDGSVILATDVCPAPPPPPPPPPPMPERG